MPSDSFSLYAPTRLLFGPGQLGHLHEQPLPGKRAMLVISNGKSTRANGYLDRTLEQLRLAGVDAVLFDKVAANPTKQVVEEGAHFAREHGVDFIVALGGGSVMDAAKVMALLAPQPSDDLWDYATGSTGKNLPLQKPEVPWVAITTTAGTGSEVDRGGVISKLDTHEKIGISSPNNFARIAVVDPELMLSVPPKFTAYQGFDALFHNMEGYICNIANPFGQMVQLEAMRNIGAWLPVAVRDGSNLEARTHVAYANTMGGYSMDVASNCSEHSMEHAMSAFHPNLPHGAGLTMISLAYFGYWVGRHVCDDRFVAMARALGKTGATKPEDFLEALHDLQVACGVDGLRMSDYGFAGTRDEALLLARTARETMGRLFAADPAPTTDEDIAGIYLKSYR